MPDNNVVPLEQNNTQVVVNREFAQSLIDAKVIPSGYKTPEMVMIGIQKGRELGMPPLAALSNLSLINGIPSPSVHLLVAKAREAGSVFEIVKDYEAIYDPVLDLQGNPVMIEDTKAPGTFVPQVKKDIITSIRVNQFKQGKWFSYEIGFRWSEAIMQELNKKDNWIKMPRLMMRARAMAIAARSAEPGATMGLYTDEEMSMIHNVPYTPPSEI